ncbi:MAG: hypothetical protein LAN18_05165 [Acidobacteriia bacterium]|nr:hypothetical protein [Terriglobia bacterium]
MRRHGVITWTGRITTWPKYNDAKSQIFKTFSLEVNPTYVVLGGDGSIFGKVYDTDPQRSIAYRLKDILAKRPELNPN